MCLPRSSRVLPQIYSQLFQCGSFNKSYEEDRTQTNSVVSWMWQSLQQVEEFDFLWAGIEESSSRLGVCITDWHIWVWQRSSSYTGGWEWRGASKYIFLSQTSSKGSEVLNSRKWVPRNKDYCTGPQSAFTRTSFCNSNRSSCFGVIETFDAHLIRWRLYLQPYKFTIHHWPGKQNGNADHQKHG